MRLSRFWLASAVALWAASIPTPALAGPALPSCSAQAEDDVIRITASSARKARGKWVVELVVTSKANIPIKMHFTSFGAHRAKVADANGYSWDFSSKHTPEGWLVLEPGGKARGEMTFSRATGDTSANSMNLTLWHGYGPAEGRWTYTEPQFVISNIPADCAEPPLVN